MTTRIGALSITALIAASASCSGSGGAPAGVRSDEPTGETTAALGSLDCADTGRYELTGVGGANFNTLAVDTTILPMADVGKVLANDQIHMLRMASDAGLAVLDKHVPAFVIFDQSGNVVSVQSGGFYQCATLADCEGYLNDVVAKYALDGVLFNDRPYFHHSFAGHSYEVIGGAQFQDIPRDYAIKITRWSVPASVPNPHALIASQWPLARLQACRRGTLAQAHLLWSESERVAAEVTIGVAVQPAPGDPTPYYVETLGALAGQDVLDPLFDRLSWPRIAPPVTDTYLVLTYWPSWFAPSRWPNSPSATPGGPLPEPTCGDGSCNTTVTHEEDPVTCPVDCAPGCGDGVCEVDENADTCAIDCPP
jgi:hypothetical protein